MRSQSLSWLNLKGRDGLLKAQVRIGSESWQKGAAAALAVVGLAMSDRDSRWLVKQLSLSYEGEPGPVWPLGQAAGSPNLNIDN
jgi:hypothetical protein